MLCSSVLRQVVRFNKAGYDKLGFYFASHDWEAFSWKSSLESLKTHPRTHPRAEATSSISSKIFWLKFNKELSIVHLLKNNQMRL